MKQQSPSIPKEVEAHYSGDQPFARIDVDKSSSHHLSQSEVARDNPVRDTYLDMQVSLRGFIPRERILVGILQYEPVVSYSSVAVSVRSRRGIHSTAGVFFLITSWLCVYPAVVA